MTRTLTRLALIGSVSAGLALPLSLGTAWANDAKSDTFALTSGHTVFVPHVFNGFHGELYDTAGNLVDSFDEDGDEVQGSGKQKGDQVCSYTFREVSDGSDPEVPVGYTFVGVGGVTGQLTGKR